MPLPDISTLTPEQLRALTDEDLQALLGDAYDEVQRRATLAAAPAEAEALAARYADAIGREDGDQWAAPTGAHNAYPRGAIVTHQGKQWESLTPANVWEPGVSGWREQAADDPDTGEPGVADYVAPTGEHDAYQIGDRVRFDGKVWESVIDGNVWSPAAHAAGWKLIA